MALAAAVWLAAVQVGAQTAPGAPANLTYVVRPGGGLTIQWTHATGPFTHYWIEAAGAAGAAPFLILPTSSFSVGSATTPSATTPGYYAKLPELVPAFSAGGIGQGNYFVRIRGVNGGAVGDPSNEIELPVRSGCYPPGAPTNFGAIVRGTLGLFQWQPGNGGQPDLYIVQANFAPNQVGAPIQLPLGTPYFNIGIPTGSYYVRVVAANACGTSAPSNEILVTAPSDTPARTPDPPAGERLPQPYVRDLVAQFAAEARNLGYLNPQVACPQRAGNFVDPVEARKTQRNAYIDYIVTRLRQIDQRFGFNAKPTRAWVPSIIAGDEIAYHHGSDPSEGSPNVYLVDVLGGHCTGISGDQDRHTPDYRVFYDEFGRWTLAGLAP